MKHVSILVPHGNVVIDTVIAPYNLLLMANSYYRRENQSNEALFKIDLVGMDLQPVKYQGLFSVQPTATIEEVENTDLIIVSAISGSPARGIERNAAFIDWIRQMRVRNDSEIASLCKGAFLLAETGLMNGKSCSTHWTAHNEFRKRYPEVNLISEKIISEDKGIYSSGGAYSFLNFMLFLIEKYYGREIAIKCSKVSEIEFDRLEQSQFMIFNGQKDHEDELILQAQHYIEDNYDQKLNIDSIADKVNVSPRSFLRRFKKATSNTPIEYIQRVKVEAAKKEFESSTSNIQEVMLDIGYNDPQAFRNVFKKYTGLSPLEYRKKYNREMALA